MAKESQTTIGIKTYSHIYTQLRGQHEQLVQVDRLEEPLQEPSHQKQPKQEPGQLTRSSPSRSQGADLDESDPDEFTDPWDESYNTMD